MPRRTERAALRWALSLLVLGAVGGFRGIPQRRGHRAGAAPPLWDLRAVSRQDADVDVALDVGGYRDAAAGAEASGVSAVIEGPDAPLWRAKDVLLDSLQHVAAVAAKLVLLQRSGADDVAPLRAEAMQLLGESGLDAAASQALLDPLVAALRRPSRADPDFEAAPAAEAAGAAVLRLSVPVTRSADPLEWLAAQEGGEGRALFANSERTVYRAGIGAALTLEGADGLSAEEWGAVGRLPEGCALIGGLRFDRGTPEGERGDEWSAFGGHRFVLPAVELLAERLEGGGQRAMLSVHASFRDAAELDGALRETRALLEGMRADGRAAGSVPRAVRREESGSREEWEGSVSNVLSLLQQRTDAVEKVVLARRVDFILPADGAAPPLDAVALLAALCEAERTGRADQGHLILMEPRGGGAFLGVSPERLFRADGAAVQTEALAGTRPRGADVREDAALGAELLASAKDDMENTITERFIFSQLRSLRDAGLLSEVSGGRRASVKRFTAVQHICRGISAGVRGQALPVHSNLAPRLLDKLHPTPAVCGEPRGAAQAIIAGEERFDRGWYAGPFGVLSPGVVDLTVAIRTVLVHDDARKLSAFSGVGVVEGSTPQGEWDETNAKVSTIAKTLGADAPPQPLLRRLRAMPNLNAAWAFAVVEELVRNGVSTFFVCPGSRSTPLATAIARHAGATAHSLVDERGAAFAAVGFARATGGAAAVLTSSGTAVANLLPAAIEAKNDNVPLVLLTADRPVEATLTGANQAIQQRGIFGDNVLLARDLSAPTPEVPLPSLLSDVDLVAATAVGAGGPTHLNLPFRENLAPVAGPVRGDARARADAPWDADLWLDAPRTSAWAHSDAPYTRHGGGAAPAEADALRFAEAALSARSGVIVAGRLPSPADAEAALFLAETLRWPIIADVQSGLRAAEDGGLVVRAAGLVLGSSAAAVVEPDVVLQLGAPVVSTAVEAMVRRAARAPRFQHVVVHPASQGQRRDPNLSATWLLSLGVEAFARAVAPHLRSARPSDLRALARMDAAAARAAEDALAALEAEGEVAGELDEMTAMRIVNEALGEEDALVLSNSMPIRDADTLLGRTRARRVLCNRGASGIDGVVHTAIGAATERRTVLCIGDVAFLHDLNALHGARTLGLSDLTIVVVNNGGGGIFHFLPIADFEDAFDPLHSTPHDTSFAGAAETFGLDYALADTPRSLREALAARRGGARPLLVEAKVLDAKRNVALHRELSAAVGRSMDALRRSAFLTTLPRGGTFRNVFYRSFGDSAAPAERTVVMLHGWMGSGEDCAPAARRIADRGFRVLSVDLPGHGATAPLEERSGAVPDAMRYGLEGMAAGVAALLESLGLEASALAAVVGYSLGGRVAMHLCEASGAPMALLSANPGIGDAEARYRRMLEDDALAEKIARSSDGEHRAFLRRWYENPMWGELADSQESVEFTSMVERRFSRCDRAKIAKVLRLGSAGRQRDFSGHLAQVDRALFLAGELDERYAAAAERLAAANPRVRARVIKGCGHALLEQCSAEVADEVLSFVEGAAAAAPPPAAPAAEVRPRSLELSPFEVSAERRGVYVVLRDESGASGVGEALPLAGFHEESLADAEEQLLSIAAHWSTSPPAALASEDALRLDGGVRRWLAGALPEGLALLDTVRFALETAVLQLASRERPLSDWASLSHLPINGIWEREEPGDGARDAQSEGVPVLKVKVASDRGIYYDAQRVTAAYTAVTAREAPAKGQKPLRLDANRKWTLKEALKFANLLPKEVRRAIEYVEEPLRPADDAEEHYAALLRFHEETGIPFALDEALFRADAEEVETMLGALRDGCGALILKPSRIGVENAARIAKAAAANGINAVYTSAFESSVALAAIAFLAARANAGAQGPFVAHGIGTYAKFDEPDFSIGDYVVGGVLDLRAAEAAWRDRCAGVGPP